MPSNPIAPREKLLWHPDRLAELRKTGKTAAPVNVEVDLSNRCSLGCEWCHFAYTHTRGPLKGKRDKPAGAVLGGDLMAEDLALELPYILARAGVRSVTWTGGGEPTLHPNFQDVVIQSRHAGLPQGLYTHGGHVDEYLAGVLKRNLTFVYVSLDAKDAETYKAAKGVNRFDKACEGIAHLVAVKGRATIGVGFLLTADNWHDMHRMKDLAKELGADYAQFRPTIRYSQDNPGEPDEDTGWLWQPLREQLDGLAADPFVQIDVSRFREYHDWRGHGYDTCWWSMFQTCITPNGKVWTCVNKREHPSAEIGDLTTESFGDIWRRHTVAKVTGECRVMCRGHLANKTLDALMTEPAHADFV